MKASSLWIALRIAGVCTLMAADLSVLQAAGEDAIVGAWLTEDRTSKVQIDRNGTAYAGKVVWLSEPERNGKPVQDAKNSNAALRSRPILGLEVLSGFTYTTDGRWTGGTIYSPRTGRSYSAELSTTSDGKLDIKVKQGMLSKHLYWTR